MIKGFKEFLFKNNVLALAVAVIVGGAVGKVVSSLAADILMPLIGLVMPAGDWRTAKLVLSTTTGPDGKEVVSAITYGNFLGSVVDFVIIAFVVYMITKSLLKEAPAAPPPPPAREELPALQGIHRHRRHQVQVLHRRHLDPWGRRGCKSRTPAGAGRGIKFSCPTSRISWPGLSWPGWVGPTAPRSWRGYSSRRWLLPGTCPGPRTARGSRPACR